MGTYIHSRVAEKECLMDNFFFDEKYMDICHNASEASLSFLKEKRPDGSKTMIPVDLNGTKVKLFSNADAFIAEFAGEDLRNVVFRDVNTYFRLQLRMKQKKQ